MKIAHKLTLSFLAFTVLIVVLGHISLREIGHFQEMTSLSTTQHVSNMRVVAQNKEYARDMRYYDEVLTQSARNYAFTGDKKWRTRYLEAEPILDAIIKDALNISDATEREKIMSTDAANIALVEMEHKSIEYVDKGQPQEALAILEGEEYWAQKDIYRAGLEEHVSLTSQWLKQTIDAYKSLTEHIVDDTERISKESRETISYFVAASLALTLLLGVYAHRMLTKPLKTLTDTSRRIAVGDFDIKLEKRPNDEIGELYLGFEHMAKDLKKANDTLKRHSEEMDKSVQERTTELQAKVLELERTRAAVLNMFADLGESKAGVDRKIEERTHELEKALTEIKEADKVKDDFLAITSHELKTPLTSIIGLTQLLEEELAEKTNPDEKEDLKIVLEEANRLKRLIDEILELARLDAGRKTFKMSELDMGKIAAEVIYELKAFSEQNKVTVKTDETKAPPVLGDFEGIKRTLYNLVNNAIKYSSEVGEKQVTIGAYREGEDIITYVRDNGIGIPDSAKEKMFERFYQVDSSISRKHGGTGLGLAICKKIIDAHTGRIWYDSKIGAGTTFYFSLPIFTNKTEEAR